MEKCNDMEIVGNIVSWKIVTDDSDTKGLEVPKEKTDLFEDHFLYKRIHMEHGVTLKTKFSSNENMYVTINFDQSGIPREIFINKSSTESDEWCKVTSRLISAILRRCRTINDAMFLIDDLLRIKGDEAFSNGSRFVHGSVQSLGLVLQEAFSLPSEYRQMIGAKIPSIMSDTEAVKNNPEALECPECMEMSYVNSGGCFGCTSCGFSKCG